MSVNERLRFLRYEAGQQFLPHYDGCYARPKGDEVSKITIQIYLNEGAEGGTTRFLDVNDDSVYVDCVPRTGRVLLFEHHLLHQGSEVLSGLKYTMRSDIMYRKAPTPTIAQSYSSPAPAAAAVVHGM